MSLDGKFKSIEYNSKILYNKGYAEGLNSAPPDYLPCTTTLKFSNYNLFGKKAVVLNIPFVTNYNGFMQQLTPNTTVEHLTINGAMDGTITNAAMAFYCGFNETTLKRLTLNCDFSNCTAVSYMFNYLAALEVIDGQPLDFSSVTGMDTFHGCPLGSKLKEIRFVPLSIKTNIKFSNDNQLSNNSIQSIIDGLANLTGEATKTVTFGWQLGPTLTDEQKAEITAKNWTLAY